MALPDRAALRALGEMEDEDAREVERRERCHGDRDGECHWSDCPQLREYQPHCPLDDRQRATASELLEDEDGAPFPEAVQILVREHADLVKRAEDAEAREARLRAFIQRLGQALRSLGLNRLADEAERALATPDADAQDEAP